MRSSPWNVLGAAGALLLAAPGGAAAGPPDATPSRITLGKAIGGVSVGQPYRQAKAAWGKDRGRCTLARVSSVTNGGGGPSEPPGPEHPWSCTYGSYTQGEARFETAGSVDAGGAPQESTVSLIKLSAGHKGSSRGTIDAFVRPYTSFRTAKGIGLGSREASLRKAYPGLKRTTYAEPGRLALRRPTYLRSGTTIFGVDDGRIVEIIICPRC